MENNLKKVLKEKNISIDDFAKMADVSVNTVKNWRKADKLPPYKKMQKISKLLGIEVSLIFKI